MNKMYGRCKQNKLGGKFVLISQYFDSFPSKASVKESCILANISVTWSTCVSMTEMD